MLKKRMNQRRKETKIRTKKGFKTTKEIHRPNSLPTNHLEKYSSKSAVKVKPSLRWTIEMKCVTIFMQKDTVSTIAKGVTKRKTLVIKLVGRNI